MPTTYDSVTGVPIYTPPDVEDEIDAKHPNPTEGSNPAPDPAAMPTIEAIILTVPRGQRLIVNGVEVKLDEGMASAPMEPA